MMLTRELKFRAWDGLVMHHDYVVGRPQAANVLKLLTDEEYAKSQYGVREWKVMQFTGLKDKNGKEIYEGDITTNGHDHCLIVWRQDLASFALSKHGWMYDHYFGEAVDPGYVEVVGNIHQNKDLLIPNE